MRKIRLIKVFVFVLAVTIFSCNSTENNKDENKDTVAVTDSANVTKDVTVNEQDTSKEVTAVNTTAKFKCPMNCPNGFKDEAGKCPDCGMDLIENPDFKNTEN